jgi:hypothetical protein
MMAYCKHVITRFAESLANSTFDQDSVAHFIVMARDYSAKRGVIRELGDFLAHPTGRNTGLVFVALEKSAVIFESFLLAPRVDRDAAHLRVPYDPMDKKVLHEELLGIFTQAGVVCNVQIKSSAFEDFVACVIFLLQYCQVTVNGVATKFELHYGHGLSLNAMYESKKFNRNFAKIPLLYVHNINRSYTGPDHELNHFVARRFEDGRLIAISYADDHQAGAYTYDWLEGKTAHLLTAPP